MIDHKKIQADRRRAAQWVKALSLVQVHDLLDAMILGSFDWRDYFDDKPTSAFINAAFDEAQYREESESF